MKKLTDYTNQFSLEGIEMYWQSITSAKSFFATFNEIYSRNVQFWQHLAVECNSIGLFTLRKSEGEREFALK